MKKVPYLLLWAASSKRLSSIIIPAPHLSAIHFWIKRFTLGSVFLPLLKRLTFWHIFVTVRCQSWYYKEWNIIFCGFYGWVNYWESLANNITHFRLIQFCEWFAGVYTSIKSTKMKRLYIVCEWFAWVYLLIKSTKIKWLYVVCEWLVWVYTLIKSTKIKWFYVVCKWFARVTCNTLIKSTKIKWLYVVCKWFVRVNASI